MKLIMGLLLLAAFAFGDDHGNSMSTATTIESSTIQGNIERGRDVDFFKIVLSSPGNLTIYTTAGIDRYGYLLSSIDTYGYLLNSFGSMLTYNDDGGADYNFRISRHLTAGTYYIKVRDYWSFKTGHYTLHTEFVPDRIIPTPTPTPLVPNDDHGNSRAAATTVRLSSATEGNIERSGDEDYFKIVILGSGTLVTYTTGSTDTLGYLIGEDASYIAYNDDGGAGYNFRIERRLTAGTYYIKVKPYFYWRTGRYTLHVKFTYDDSTLYDDYGNSTDTARMTELNSTTQGNLETDFDMDYFKLNVPSAGTLVTYTTGSTDTYGELLRSNGVPIARNTYDGPNRNFRISKHIEAGLYYIRVSHNFRGTGSYALRVEFTADTPILDDHGDSLLTATDMIVNGTIQGSIETAGDEDWFRLEVPSYGRLVIYTTGDTDTAGYLGWGDIDTYGYITRREANSQTLENDNDGTGQNFRIVASDIIPGVFYFRVKHHDATGTGSYVLHVEFQ